MAGIGEKPMMRSGPYFLTVYIVDAAVISRASSHDTRRKPPLPRACWMDLRADGFSITLAQASTGSGCFFFASRHRSISTPRMYGYLTRIGLYWYHEKEMPR